MGKAGVCPGVFLCALVVLAGGCFSSNPADIEAWKIPAQVVVSADKYILQPPDEIEIHCSRVPEINLQRQRIRPDGKVSFEAIGEVSAAGKTPKELAGLIYEKVVTLYTLAGENPVDVQVVVYRGNVYYVLGQVYLPGPRIYTGRDTVLRALAEARPNPMAWVERIQVIRPSNDPLVAPRIFEFNYDKMIAHGDMSKDVLLEPGDIVFVPPTVLAAIALKVEEFVRPIGRAFSTVNIVTGDPGVR